jgi:asparagine synthase (glutamine-hydrolysing)
MCGISGIINPIGFKLEEILKSTMIIKHRGPNDEGFVSFKSFNSEALCFGGQDTPSEVYESEFQYKPTRPFEKNGNDKIVMALGHRRLSILDLSSAGHQPMSYLDMRYWIVFNGEIYNYLEIRQELQVLGYNFVSNSDTEVILAAYHHWGIECQYKFNGMWAFVLYDSVEKKLFISRDRFGIKPFYYWFAPDGSFCFGSEIKQFTVLSGWKAKLNHQRAFDYLFYSLTDHTDETMFNGVYNVPAGCCFVSSISAIKPNNENKIACTRWYIPKYVGSNYSFDQAKEKFLEIFKSAIDLHLRSDVPVGSALSGGVDSSAIVSYVNILLRQKRKADLQKTFTSCSFDKRYDEKKWVDEVIKHTAVDAHFVYPEGKEVFSLTDKLIWHHDEPYQSQSALLGYHVFEKAKNENVLVLLNGQGADEYLSGYSAFKIFRHNRYLRKLKIRQIFNESEQASVIEKWGYLIRLFYHNIPFKIAEQFSFCTKEYNQKRNLITNCLNYKKTHPYNLIPYKMNSIFNIAYHQLLFEPLQKYLRWEDRNSMAHSVEARVPFLDHRLVEFTTQLPVYFLDSTNESKKIMFQALKDILPEAIRNRKDKKGFITPEERWFKDDFYDEFIEYFKSNVQFSQGIINEKNAIEYMFKVKSGTLKFDYTYWRIILFCVWMKVFKVSL